MFALDIGDLNVAVDPDPDELTQPVNAADVEGVERPGDGRQSFFRAQRVAVTHGPQVVRLITQRCAEIAQTVDLVIARLPDAAANRHEIVTEDRGGSRGNCAGRSLGVVIDVPSDAVLGADVRPGHFKEIELGGDLKERTAVGWIAMHAPHVARDRGDAEPPAKSVDDPCSLVSEFLH